MIHGLNEPGTFPCSACHHRVPEDTLERTAPGRYLCEECADQRATAARDALIVQTAALLSAAMRMGPVVRKAAA